MAAAVATALVDAGGADGVELSPPTGHADALLRALLAAASAADDR
jgi:hypothetical protein